MCGGGGLSTCTCTCTVQLPSGMKLILAIFQIGNVQIINIQIGEFIIGNVQIGNKEIFDLNGTCRPPYVSPLLGDGECYACACNHNCSVATGAKVQNLRRLFQILTFPKSTFQYWHFRNQKFNGCFQNRCLSAVQVPRYINVRLVAKNLLYYYKTALFSHWQW